MLYFRHDYSQLFSVHERECKTQIQNKEQLYLTQYIKVHELLLHLFLQNILNFNFGHKEKTSEE